LSRKDEVIRRLTEDLRQTAESRDLLSREYTVDVKQLVDQVQLLQGQLRQVRPEVVNSRLSTQNYVTVCYGNTGPAGMMCMLWLM